MSVLLCAPDDSEDDETTELFGVAEGTDYSDDEIEQIVNFGAYVRETWEHIERMCSLIAGANVELHDDLALVAKFLWA